MNCAVKDLVTICSDPYEAANQAHAIIVATEWDEFAVSTDFYSGPNTVNITTIIASLPQRRHYYENYYYYSNSTITTAATSTAVPCGLWDLLQFQARGLKRQPNLTLVFLCYSKFVLLEYWCMLL